ncbi:calcium-activated chloride channel regulator 3A-1 isoform X2 [Anolis carolinensis]|uniref:calcium-activated chloride channel regulator 3A-1 isoform X2 n=1 Tax=Anolis carolinensis TaxID=28377 RepID=UPI002F2B8D47
MEQKWWDLFVALLLLLDVKGSLVKLHNGGYEDVVIGIHPKIAENAKIINSIKDMLKEASSYLFLASQQRFYFRTVKIVIPLTWASKPEYKRSSRESYVNADIIVAEPFVKYGDEPYTSQYGGCGKKGRYIHFTSNFLINDSLVNIYGSRGRILVHEWAHLRWGVFEEYSYDAPFYSSGINKIEATRCSASINGQYRFATTGGRTRRCRIERHTELYEPGCLFIPYKKQTSLASIMFMQSLSSVSQFCDKSNHNFMAPNMQNKMCSYKSTWEVISGSADFASSRPLGAPPPDPIIHLMKTRERIVCLVLDASAQMGKVFSQKLTSTEGCEIVLLTNGEGSDLSPCLSKIQSQEIIIHTIAFGSKASNELEKLADMTGGKTFYATDSLDSNGLIDAFGGISSGSGDASQQSIQLESKAEKIAPMKWLQGVVTIDKTVGKDTLFLIAWSSSTSTPEISLTDPKEKKYLNKDFRIENSNIRTAVLKISGTATTGNWPYSIKNTDSADQVISLTVTTRAASATVPPVTVKTYISNSNNSFPNPMIIYADVSQGFLPVIGAKVMATVESTSGKPVELALYDEGAGADIIKHDGIYSRYFIAFSDNGRYSIKVSVHEHDKTSRRIRRQNQAMYVSGYVDSTGGIVLNPPRPVINVTDASFGLGNFDRISSAADRYEIKMSGNPFDLIDVKFASATSLDTSALKPEFSGVKQTFQYKPDELTKENGTLMYFAIRAIDESDNVGEVSNIARATRLFRAAPPSTSTQPFVVIVLCFAVIGAVLGIALYALHKWKQSRRESMVSMD